MKIQVIYQDNKMGKIDKTLLDEMISVNKIKMFMRSEGWAMVGVSSMRGSGGMYTGIDRRGLYGMTDDSIYQIIT